MSDEAKIVLKVGVVGDAGTGKTALIRRFVEQRYDEDSRYDAQHELMLARTQLSNYLTLKGLFSAVSKPNFASKYALGSSCRDLQNALLSTVL